MRKVKLGTTGESIPVIGQGTWGIEDGKDKEYYEKWKDSLKKGIELGMTHLDTAEVYGNGAAERMIGELLEESVDRDEVFITSKLFPIHMMRKSMRKATQKSLERLGIDCFDLYLIHWPNPFMINSGFMKYFDELIEEGKTRYVGVSNFFPWQVKKAREALKNGELVTNQIRLNVTYQKPIKNSLSFYQDENILITAYSPLGHGGLHGIDDGLKNKLEKIGQKHDITIQQVALAWLVNHDGIIAIPKAFDEKHVEANAKAADIVLSESEIKSLY